MKKIILISCIFLILTSLVAEAANSQPTGATYNSVAYNKSYERGYADGRSESCNQCMMNAEDDDQEDLCSSICS
ncbi:MAG: hypothetical protein K0S63_228 [Gammaproteobacteria bacterium]|jgi:hypothetical protein|nr:hypothetical protein [Gammaproteobacteria bacterium]